MGDENPRHTLGDYSRPSQEGYRNTIKVPNGNDLEPLRSDTIRLVQNGCSFYRIWRTIAQAAGGKLRDKNDEESWALLEDLALYNNESWNDPTKVVPIASERRIIEHENQFQHPERDFVEYASMCTDEAENKWYTFKPEDNNLGDTYNPSWKSYPNLRRTIDQAAGGKLHDKNDKESWALLEDLALYDNESWNDPRDFAKPVKAISMPHDV
nr:MAK10-like protein [Tanacetum cinerariifolium]GEZ55962.1 MAK10-like protein [Tanacetum cinerariifolium]